MSCRHPSCAPIRSLLRHYNACKGLCNVCDTVSTEMSGGWQAKMSEQAEHQESVSSAHSNAGSKDSGSYVSAPPAVDQDGPIDLQRQSSDDTAEVQDSVTQSSSQHPATPEGTSSQASSQSPSIQERSEHDQIFDATKWMVHALMAPATTDSFGQAMWGHVLGCCDGSAPCPSGLMCKNVKSTMRHLLQCQDAACPLCASISSFFSGAGRKPHHSQTSEEVLAQTVTRPHDIECLIQKMEQSLDKLKL